MCKQASAGVPSSDCGHHLYSATEVLPRIHERLGHLSVQPVLEKVNEYATSQRSSMNTILNVSGHTI